MPGPQAWDSGKCLFVASKPMFLFFLTPNSGFLKARVTARAAHVRGRRRGHLEASLRGPLRLGLRVRCPPCAVTSASTGRAPLLPPLLGLSSWRSRSPPRRLLLHPRTVPSSQPQERLTRACRLSPRPVRRRPAPESSLSEPRSRRFGAEFAAAPAASQAASPFAQGGPCGASP